MCVTFNVPPGNKEAMIPNPLTKEESRRFYNCDDERLLGSTKCWIRWILSEWTKRTVIGCLTCQSNGIMVGPWPMNQWKLPWIPDLHPSDYARYDWLWFAGYFLITSESVLLRNNEIFCLLLNRIFSSIILLMRLFSSTFEDQDSYIILT